MVEDPNDDTGRKKRYKRPVANGMVEDDGGVLMTVREPFMFNEHV